MSSLRYRLALLEGATKHRLKPGIKAYVVILLGERTPAQQNEIDAARREGRPVLVIVGMMPTMPADYGVIVEVENESPESNIKPRFDRTGMVEVTAWK